MILFFLIIHLVTEKKRLLKKEKRTIKTGKMACCRVNFTRQQWMVTATFIVVNFCNAMCVSMQVYKSCTGVSNILLSFIKEKRTSRPLCGQFHQPHLAQSGNATPGVNFINILTYTFSVQTLFQQLFLVTVWLWQKICTKNACVKQWWNWHQQSLFFALQFLHQNYLCPSLPVNTTRSWGLLSQCWNIFLCVR